jgi:uncharacterized protein YndB with AHSA1/START domain
MSDDAQRPGDALAPVIKEVGVPLDQRRAFELFTRRIGEWWPLATHSVEGDRALGCAFEERAGGRLYEIGPDGAEHTWGTVQTWDAPRGLTMTWHAGRGPETAQLLEVTFTPSEQGTTVRLVHSGWEALGEEAAQERANYEPGWDYVLSFFTPIGA